MAIDIKKILAKSKPLLNGESRLQEALKDIKRQIVSYISDETSMKKEIDYAGNNEYIYLSIYPHKSQSGTIYIYSMNINLGSTNFKLDDLSTTDDFNGEKMMQSFINNLINTIFLKFKEYGLMKIAPYVDEGGTNYYTVNFRFNNEMINKSLKKSEIARYVVAQRDAKIKNYVEEFSKISKTIENYTRTKEFEKKIEELFLEARKNEVDLFVQIYSVEVEDPDDLYGEFTQDIVYMRIYDELSKNRFEDLNDELSTVFSELACPYTNTGAIGEAMKVSIWTGLEWLSVRLESQGINASKVDAEKINLTNKAPIKIHLFINNE